ncbi:flagellar assembly protein FliW [Candidatus Laterigemmans baculatus]|uniref:flagellar assembly protein FliW n=1 Tax=Candidatus Laterigemmans baculatus TaxID=2770505 RepID=UPI0013D9051A|nr:flagellar assembly protein FliW [Candidatus Laterigemmans baculatus]
MRIDTTRFGTLDIQEREMFLFPQGLIGLETLRQWLLLPDPQSPAVAWLQSASRSDVALAMVSPRAFVEGYRVRAPRRALSGLQLRSGDELYVLTTLNRRSGQWLTNLRAPLVLNLRRRVGCQVITEDNHSVAYPLVLERAGRLAA